jgi:hypothetical protein
MPSLLHQSLVMLFRNRPELAPELLEQALSLRLPAYTEVRIESADLGQIAPTEYHADLVVLLVNGRPVLAIVLEVQLGRDGHKRWTWPLYAASARARYECEVCVLVVTPSTTVARWATEPIVIGPGNTFQPLVVGPEGVPVVTDPEAARADPELAVLSAMAHGKGNDKPETGAQVAFAALSASLGLEDERALLYSDLIRISLGRAARKALEAMMAIPEGYEFQSEFARKHDALGRAKGITIGEAQGQAKAVIGVLEARGLHVSDEQRERILGCKDLEQLAAWVRRVGVVSSADELFAEADPGQ